MEYHSFNGVPHGFTIVALSPESLEKARNQSHGEKSLQIHQAAHEAFAMMIDFLKKYLV